MKAILLAAGRGTRIARNVEMVPKSTLPVDGKPLIRRSVEILQGEGMEVVVCTGYREEIIREALEGLENITYVYNPFYDITNSIASLWFARDLLDDDILVMNADVFFSKDILHPGAYFILEHPFDFIHGFHQIRSNEIISEILRKSLPGRISFFIQKVFIDEHCGLAGINQIHHLFKTVCLCLIINPENVCQFTIQDIDTHAFCSNGQKISIVSDKITDPAIIRSEFN